MQGLELSLNLVDEVHGLRVNSRLLEKIGSQYQGQRKGTTKLSWGSSLKTLTSLNKESRPFFQSDR